MSKVQYKISKFLFIFVEAPKRSNKNIRKDLFMINIKIIEAARMQQHHGKSSLMPLHVHSLICIFLLVLNIDNVQEL